MPPAADGYSVLSEYGRYPTYVGVGTQCVQPVPDLGKQSQSLVMVTHGEQRAGLPLAGQQCIIWTRECLPGDRRPSECVGSSAMLPRSSH